METKLIIRSMQETDVPAVSRLEEEVFSMPWSPSAFLEMLRSENACYLVAELQGEIVGCCGLRNIVGEGEITNVAVKEAFRGRHIARQLLTELLYRGASMGIYAYTLEVRESNAPALRLYEGLGFAREGLRPGFYEKPAEAAVIMWKR